MVLLFALGSICGVTLLQRSLERPEKPSKTYDAGPEMRAEGHLVREDSAPSKDVRILCLSSSFER